MAPVKTLTRPTTTSPTTRTRSTAAQIAAADQRKARRRSEMIATFMPLAQRLARSFHGRGEDIDDLTQVAMLGLIKSVDRFDDERGIPFAKFAVPTILGELKKHFRDSAWSLHVTRRMQELHMDISRATPELTQTLGRTPTPADLAVYLDIPEADVLAGMHCGSAYNTRSLNAPVTVEEGAVELGSLLGGVDERLDSVPDRAALRQHVAELPPRVQQIVNMRFVRDLTQSQIAQSLGISQMHVSRLLSQSLKLLRHRLIEA